MKKRGPFPLLESIPYVKPDGSRGSFKPTDKEYTALRRLSPKGVMRSALAALHLSLLPLYDDGGKRLTDAMREALEEAIRTGTLPPPHPGRNLPRQETAEDLRDQLMAMHMREYDLVMWIDQLAHAQPSPAAA